MDFEPKSPNYMDAAFAYDSLSGLKPFVQYPYFLFVVIQMGREYYPRQINPMQTTYQMPVPGHSSGSPRLNFNSLNLASNLTDYASYVTGT